MLWIIIVVHVTTAAAIHGNPDGDTTCKQNTTSF
jgi:hypothetical protein